MHIPSLTVAFNEELAYLAHGASKTSCNFKSQSPHAGEQHILRSFRLMRQKMCTMLILAELR